MTPPAKGSPAPELPKNPEEGSKPTGPRRSSRSASVSLPRTEEPKKPLVSALREDFDVDAAVRDLRKLHKYIPPCPIPPPFLPPSLWQPRYPKFTLFHIWISLACRSLASMRLLKKQLIRRDSPLQQTLTNAKAGQSSIAKSDFQILCLQAAKPLQKGWQRRLCEDIETKTQAFEWTMRLVHTPIAHKGYVLAKATKPWAVAEQCTFCSGFGWRGVRTSSSGVALSLQMWSLWYSNRIS